MVVGENIVYCRFDEIKGRDVGSEVFHPVCRKVIVRWHFADKEQKECEYDDYHEIRRKNPRYTLLEIFLPVGRAHEAAEYQKTTENKKAADGIES